MLLEKIAKSKQVETFALDLLSSKVVLSNFKYLGLLAFSIIEKENKSKTRPNPNFSLKGINFVLSPLS